MFGLHSAPATFQAMMNNNFAEELKDGNSSIYLDDYLLHTKTKQQMYDGLEHVLKKVISLKTKTQQVSLHATGS